VADLTLRGKTAMKNFVYVFFASVLFVAVPCGFAQQTETQLIGVLKSNAPVQQKADACIELSKIGSRAAVAPLAALLDNAELAHMAVYALEPNPDPAAGEALRNALGRLSGRPRLTVIHALGMRRDAQAVDALSALLKGTDRDAADAAASALSRIATPQAIVALKAALGNVPAAAEGLLRCAETAPSGQAAALCDALLAAPLPQPLRVAAARRAILACGKDGIPLLLKELGQSDAFAVNGALRTAVELPASPEVSQALVAELAKLPEDRQARLAAVLAERGDVSAAPALLERVKAGSTPLRVASIQALARLGCAEAVPLLAGLVTSPDPAVAEAVFAALSGFPGTAADGAALAMLESSAAETRGVGIRLAAQRRLAAARPILFRIAANGGDAAAQSASLKVLKDLADEKDIPALLELMRKASDAEAVDEVLNAVCLRQATVLAEADVRAKRKTPLSACRVPASVADPIFAAYKNARGTSKCALIRTLVLLGGDASLEAVRVASKEADAALRETALRALCDWPTDRALPDLATLAISADVPKFRVLALRGYIRLTLSRDATLADKSAALNKVFGWAGRDDERRDVINALAFVPTPETLALAGSCFGRDGLRDDACRAAIGIGDVLACSLPEPVAEAMANVAQVCKDPDVRKRAAAVAALTKAALRERAVAADETGFVPMFNGKDLAGWDGKSTWWKVVDGVLTGETTPENPCKKSAYLLWTGAKPGDFELRTEFRLSKNANSGIQFRAGTVPEPISGAYRFAPQAAGYQADMSGNGGFVGFFWHPVLFLTARGATVTLANDGNKTEKRFADSEAIQKLYKIGEWNRYRLICRGSELTLYLNDILAARFIDNTPSVLKEGAIMLQIHQGPPMKAEYRHLRIKTL